MRLRQHEAWIGTKPVPQLSSRYNNVRAVLPRVRVLKLGTISRAPRGSSKKIWLRKSRIKHCTVSARRQMGRHAVTMQTVEWVWLICLLISRTSVESPQCVTEILLRLRGGDGSVLLIRDFCAHDDHLSPISGAECAISLSALRI
jgi:hypothetical protein